MYPGATWLINLALLECVSVCVSVCMETTWSEDVGCWLANAENTICLALVFFFFFGHLSNPTCTSGPLRLHPTSSFYSLSVRTESKRCVLLTVQWPWVQCCSTFQLWRLKKHRHSIIIYMYSIYIIVRKQLVPSLISGLTENSHQFWLSIYCFSHLSMPQ